MRRRTLLRAAPAVMAAPLTAPRLAAAEGGARTLRFAPRNGLNGLDPVASTNAVTRNHALMVYDTLFGLTRDMQVRPQMAAAHEVSPDGLVHRIALRPDLRFHDGEPVTARDCIASIERWSRRDPLGGRLGALLEEMRPAGDGRFEIVLKAPWPGLAWALGKPSANLCAVMPERVARADPFQPVTDPTGSGPYRFHAGEFEPGRHAVYERHAAYVPRDEPADFLAGGKVVQFDHVEWRLFADPAAAGAALLAGELDWWEAPPADMLPALRKGREVAVEVLNTAGSLGILRFNHLHPPFDRAELRRALLPALDQGAFMQAALGEDASLWQVPAGAFAPGSPLANEAGLEALAGPRNPEAARAALKAAGHDGRKVVLLVPTDFPMIAALSATAAELLRRVGFAVDAQVIDWATLLRRRARREAPAQGGWNVFCTTWDGLDVAVPGTHRPLRGDGAAGWPGWSTSPRREALCEAWFGAASLAEERRIAEDLQRLVWEEAPFLPLGHLRPPAAYRRSLAGLIGGGPPLFWNLRRG